jgi:hypothetical protein
VSQFKGYKEYSETLNSQGAQLGVYEIGRSFFLLFSSCLSDQPPHPCHHLYSNIFLLESREKKKEKKEDGVKERKET